MQDGIANSAGTFESGEVDLSILDAQGVPQSASGAPQQTEPTPSQKIEPDPKYSKLPREEAILRTLQSKYDLTYNEYEKAQAQIAEKEGLVNILNDILENDDAFNALVYQRKPELLKQNPEQIKVKLKEELDKEFGEGYKPQLTREEAERDDPGGKDDLYYQKKDEILGKLRSQGNYGNLKTLTEYVQNLKAERQKQQQEDLKQIEAAKTQLNMTDGEVDAVSKWAEKLSFSDLAKIRRFLLRFPKAPGAPAAGGQAPQSPFTSERERLINSLK